MIEAKSMLRHYVDQLAENAERYACFSTPLLDQFRADVPTLPTSVLVMLAADEKSVWRYVVSGSEVERSLFDPITGLQLTVACAIEAIRAEIDRRHPIPKETP